MVEFEPVCAQIDTQPGPDASLHQAPADPHGKLVYELAVDLEGAAGTASTIGGGTSEVLRNIIAERLLGLPHDLDVEQGPSWREAQGAQRR